MRQLLSDEALQAVLQRVVAARRALHIAHRSIYHVHQKVAKSFRHGRVLLAGDAAHINNPLGGMGMNGGIQDAFNLADKLQGIWAGGDDRMLDRYDRQRRTVAVEAVQQQTHRNQQIISERDPAVRAKALDDMRRDRRRQGFRAGIHAKVVDDRQHAPRRRRSNRAEVSHDQRRCRTSIAPKGSATQSASARGRLCASSISSTALSIRQSSAAAILPQAVAQTIGLLAAARRCGLPVAFSRVVYAADGSDDCAFVRKVPALATLTEDAPCEPDRRGAGAQRRSRLILRKTQPSAFFGTGYAERLRQLGVDTVIVAGCTTSGCVRATVVDAMSHDFRTIVARDCVGDRSLPAHDANLFDMEQKYADLMDADAIIAALRETAVRLSPLRRWPCTASRAPNNRESRRPSASR